MKEPDIGPESIIQLGTVLSLSDVVGKMDGNVFSIRQILQQSPEVVVLYGDLFISSGEGLDDLPYVANEVYWSLRTTSPEEGPYQGGAVDLQDIRRRRKLPSPLDSVQQLHLSSISQKLHPRTQSHFH